MTSVCQMQIFAETALAKYLRNTKPPWHQPEPDGREAVTTVAQDGLSLAAWRPRSPSSALSAKVVILVVIPAAASSRSMPQMQAAFFRAGIGSARGAQMSSPQGWR